MAERVRVTDDRDLKRGKRILARIADDLEDPEDLAHSYAEAVLEQARRNAAARPTPQAPMAAQGMRVDGSEIRSAGGISGEVATGSEFGSDIYLQFQKSLSRRGYWLTPATESEEAERAGDQALEEIMDRAIAHG